MSSISPSTETLNLRLVWRSLNAGLRIVVCIATPADSRASPSPEPGHLVSGLVLTPSTDKESLLDQILLCPLNCLLTLALILSFRFCLCIVSLARVPHPQYLITLHI